MHRLLLGIAALACSLTLSVGGPSGPAQQPGTALATGVGPRGSALVPAALAPCSRGAAATTGRGALRRATSTLARADQRALQQATLSTGGGPTGGPLLFAAQTAAGFAALSGQALVDELADPSSNLDVLWGFGDDVEAVVAQQNVANVAAEIDALGAQLAANATELENLLYFLQIALYHWFYQPSVDYDAATLAACEQAVADLASDADFLLETGPIRSLRSQWIITIDSVNGTHLVLPTIEDLVERWNADAGLANQWQERVDAFNLFFTLARQIGNANNEPVNHWLGIVPPSLTADIAPIALDLAYTPNTLSITENALYALAHYAYLDAATADAGHAIVSDAYLAFPQYSGPWFRALRDLDYFFGGQLDDGTVLDIDQIKADVAAIALPQRYEFDQGGLVFRTAISAAKAEDMYAAIQEVEAQFFRATGNVEPATGDSGDPLTLVIYASPDDYALYQPFLFGLNTNNGGIYIEGDTTLYTYDRTPQQSIFSLEELLRHEYTHFLDGRFQVQGGFYGAGTLYEGGRLDTLGEGLAEYMVGATRSNGVLRREVMLQQVANDPLGVMTIAEILLATYDLGFRFYPHAACLFEFLEEEAPDLQIELFETIRAGDLVAFDALRDAVVNDAQLEADYAAWVAANVADWQSQTGLFAEDVATVPTPSGLATGNAAAVRAAIATAAGSSGDAFFAWDGRYRFVDELSLTVPAGATAAELRDAFSSHLDATLVLGLEPQGANFASHQAWNGAIEHSGTTATATLFVEGPYLPDANDTTPPLAPSGLVGDGAGAALGLSWTASGSDDVAGYRVWRSNTPGGPYELVRDEVVIDTTTTDPDAGALLTYYAVTAVDATGNESGYSNEIRVGLERRVLVVHGYFDNGNFSNTQSYLDALDQLGLPYEVWNPFVDGPVTDALLAPYVDGMVIWAVGYTNPSFPAQFDATRRAVLRNYLDSGGNLMISGAFLANTYDTTPLFTDYFRVDAVQSGMDVPVMRGVNGNPVGGGTVIRTSFTGYASEIDVSAPAEPAYTFLAASGPGSLLSSGTAAATVDDGFRVFYLAQPFSFLTSADRLELLERATDWLIPNDPTLSLTPALAGATNTLRVTNGQPGEQVLFLVGWIPGNLPTGCPSGAKVGIANWFSLITLPCDANGEIELPIDVPSVFTGLTFLVQGAMLGSCDTTNVVTAAF